MGWRTAREQARCCLRSAFDSLGEKTNCVASNDAQISDVQHFADALLAFKGDPRMVMTAVIAGPATSSLTVIDRPHFEYPFMLAPACSYPVPEQPDATADAAIRLAAFANLFPGRSTFTSICDPELAGPLHEIGTSAKKLVGDPCLDSTKIVDISTCEVVDTRDSKPDAPVVLRPCTEALGGDCYEVVADPVACPFSEDHLRLKLNRAEVTDDLWTSVRCQVR